MTKRTSLALPPGMPLEEWRHLGRQIFVISDSSAWWLGDWLIYGKSQYPDRYKRAIAETSLDYQTLRNYAWIAKRFGVGRRRDKLSFQHHAEVASLSQSEQQRWLDQAEANEWSRNELRRRIKASRDRENGQPQREVTAIQMSVLNERKQRWQEAANQHEQDLLTWIVNALDEAAGSALHVEDELALDIMGTPELQNAK